MPADQDSETGTATQEAGTRRGQRDAAAAALADVAHEPGAPKPDPILVADTDRAAVRRPHRGRRRARRGPARGHHRADRPQRCRQDHLLQPAHRLRPARRGHLVVRGQRSLKGVAAHKVARLGMVRTFQLTKALSKLTVIENMRLGATGQKGENVFTRAVPGALGRPGARDHRAGRRPARALQAGRQARGLRRQPLRRPAQAARDGPGPDGRPGDGHARRADGRGEPGPDPVAARPRQGPARGRHDRAVRRARHGHGPRHLATG